MKPAAVVLLIGLVMACSATTAGPSASPSAGPSASSVAVASPAGPQVMPGGCGDTEVYRGGSLPDWALVNAPSLPYVIAKPDLAVGYLFSYPMKAGLDANTKILWYVGTPRDGLPLIGVGHPLNANSPTATFSKAADSSPGEIYPTSPTVPSSGCWHFTLTWRGGANRAEIDLLFS